MTRLALALAALLIAASTLAPPAEARRGHCNAWLATGGQPVACQSHTVRTWSGTHR